MTLPVVLAHGISARGDLPLPLWMVAYGAAAVLFVSFAALAALWPKARLEGAPRGVVVSERVRRPLGVLAWAVRVVGLVLFAVVTAAAFVGEPQVTNNIAPYAIYVALWVGGMLVSGLIGDVWRLLSPFETALAVRRARGADDADREVPEFGVRPAAVMLLAFAWLELVHPDPGHPRVLAMGIGLYVGVMLLGWAWAGPGWVRSADPFGAFFRLLAAMAPIARDDDGRLRLRPPMVGLAEVVPVPGTAAVVLVALGSTTYDGVTRLPAWQELVGPSTGWSTVPMRTLGLLATVAVVAGLYLGAMSVAARRADRTTAEMVAAFVHSLIPIALAYAIAHYFSLLVFEGQLLIALASDPLGRGWDLFGTNGRGVDFEAVSTTTIAWVQAGAIILGHVVGVVVAHDRAVATLPKGVATRSQYALLTAMVAYTVGGLFLLLGG